MYDGSAFQLISRPAGLRQEGLLVQPETNCDLSRAVDTSKYAHLGPELNAHDRTPAGCY
jgi:hypothetical protein